MNITALGITYFLLAGHNRYEICYHHNQAVTVLVL